MATRNAESQYVTLEERMELVDRQVSAAGIQTGNAKLNERCAKDEYQVVQQHYAA